MSALAVADVGAWSMQPAPPRSEMQSARSLVRNLYPEGWSERQVRKRRSLGLGVERIHVCRSVVCVQQIHDARVRGHVEAVNPSGPAGANIDARVQRQAARPTLARN